MATADTKPIAIRLNVIGRLEVVREPGGALELPAAPRPNQVLVLFAVKDEYGRQQLVDIIWPGQSLNDDDPVERKRIKGNLDRALTDTRQVFDLGHRAPLLRTQNGVVHRTKGPNITITSDLAEFRKLARSQSPDDWRAALALVRGPIAQHLSVTGLRTDWLEREREAQQREIIEILGKLNPESAPDALGELCRDLLDRTYVAPHILLQEPTDHDVPGVTAGKVSTDDSKERSRRIGLSHHPALIGALFLVLLLAVGAVAWAPWSSSSASIPPPGSVVDAQTGQIVTKPKATPTRNGSAGIGGGPRVLELCVVSGHRCRFVVSPLAASVGSIIEFSLELHDYGNSDVAYVKLEGHSGPASQENGIPSRELALELTIRWPVEDGPSGEVERVEEVGGHGGERPVARLQLPKSGLYGLQYIPGSTELLNEHATLRRSLPDGIMQYGIALADVGAPPNCFYCDRQDTRFVNFRAKIVAR